jgi:adenosylcobinamide-GDP ribazoletransferase
MSASDRTAAGGLGVAIGMFTAIPVPARAQRRPGPKVLFWLPVIGVAVTALAFLPALLVWRGHGHGSALLGAALIVGCNAVLTRGLHLDGAADLADGLGSRKPAAEALAIMRRPEVGAFGVTAIAMVLLLQTAGLSTLLSASSRPAALALAATAACAGRVAALRAARVGIAAAPGSALGVLMSGGVSRLAAGIATALIVAVAAIVGWFAGHTVGQVVWAVAGVAAALGAASGLCHLTARRLGGINGDVFGATVECGTTVALTVLAAATVWR